MQFHALVNTAGPPAGPPPTAPPAGNTCAYRLLRNIIIRTLQKYYIFNIYIICI